jgi:hypothetical protein
MSKRSEDSGGRANFIIGFDPEAPGGRARGMAGRRSVRSVLVLAGVLLGILAEPSPVWAAHPLAVATSISPPTLEDGPNLSTVLDPLSGNRLMVQQDDLALVKPNVVQQHWEPELLALPTDNGQVVNQISTVIQSESLAPQGQIPIQSRRARPYDTGQDVILTLLDYIPDASEPDVGYLAVNVAELVDGTTAEVTYVGRVAIDETQLHQNLPLLVVDDFDRDGYDEAVFQNGPDWMIAQAVDPEDPTQGWTIETLGPTPFPVYIPNLPYTVIPAVTGDINGDEIVDVVGMDCQNADTTACTLHWASICPGAVPAPRVPRHRAWRSRSPPITRSPWGRLGKHLRSRPSAT